MSHDELGDLADAAERAGQLEDENKRLRVACELMMIGGNHIATHRTSLWPEYDKEPELALAILGAGREYDMWCCWSAIMRARNRLEVSA